MPPQCTVAVFQIGVLVVFSNYDPVWGNELGLREEAQRLFVSAVVSVRGIKKAKVTGDCRGIEQPQCLNGLALVDLESFSDLQGPQVLADYADSPGILLGEINHPRAAAQRLNANRSRAREEIDPC